MCGPGAWLVVIWLLPHVCAVCSGAMMVGDRLFRSPDGSSHCPVCKGKVGDCRLWVTTRTPCMVPELILAATTSACPMQDQFSNLVQWWHAAAPPLPRVVGHGQHQARHSYHCGIVVIAAGICMLMQILAGMVVLLTWCSACMCLGV
jgi:hypothetical protein